jgi:hypothetical protein
MATNTTGTTARQFPYQTVHFIRRRVTFDTTFIADDDFTLVGVLPAGAIITQAIVKVETAFNASSTNLINVGIAGNDDAIVDEGDIDLTAEEWQATMTGCDLTFAADTPVYVTYDQTGDAATAGVAHVIVMYIPNNDQ